MFRFSQTVLLILLASISALTQTEPSPTPVSAGADDVVKISTNLIQVDVSVTDGKGRAVRDLRPEEFEIYENGQLQPITNFSFVSNARDTAMAEKTKGKPQQPVIPSAPVKMEQVRRTVALVADDLSLSFESVYYTRRALKKFVDEQMQEGDLVAILRTGAGIGALQQFTTDKRQLYAAIDRIRWNPVGNGNIGAFAPLESKIAADGQKRAPAAGERTPDGIESEFNDFRSSVFATGTLGAIDFVVRGMKDLPGRKSIIMLSDGFKLFNTDALGFRESGQVLGSLRRLVDAANRAAVVIYTADPRGVMITGLSAADSTSGRTGDEIEKELSGRRDQLFDTQDGLRFLARQTGGLSIINNNDLSGGIRKILDDQSYYLLGYAPDDGTFDPKVRRFNKLIVKVKRPGVIVRYRSGFFGIADEKLEAETRPPGQRRLMDALVSPFAVNEIPVRLNALFGSTRETPAYIRSLVHVKTQNFKFEDQPDGSKKFVLDILAYAFGDNGIVVDRVAKTSTITLEKRVYERFAKTGLVIDFTFPIKKPGAYQLRVAIRDPSSDTIGSANQFIEVPNLKKERLVLSGVVLENIGFDDWNLRKAGKPTTSNLDPMVDTSLRQFKRGTVLNYGFAVYNSKPGSVEGGGLSLLVRLYRDGKMIYEGNPQTIERPVTADKTLNASGSLALGTSMLPGDYIMQVVVTDKLAKEKYNSAGQFVQFEIVE